MSEQNVSRRSFLKLAGLGLTGAALTCSGAGFLATRTPGLDTPEHTFKGEDPTMNNRVLVTYATRAGSTAEIAAAIGESLSQKGYTVDVKPAKEKPDVNGYQAVIVGSAIRMGRWLPEAVKFVESNQAALNQVPVALFCVHMLHSGDDEESRTLRQGYLDPVRPLVSGAEEAYFEGAIEYARLSFLDRFIAKTVGSVEADNRNWESIRAWVPEALA